MTRKFNPKLAALVCFTLFISALASAQSVGQGLKNKLSERVRPAPESVFKMFREAGMKPVNHHLSAVERKKVGDAFALLPPLHQSILREHLQSVSFMDNMPNTALTSLIDSKGDKKVFNITFRAGILKETISEWASWKENTCFKPDSTDYEVRVDAGQMDAFIYVLLHEATHVVDAVTQITPYFVEKDSVVTPTPFTKGVWRLANVPEEPYIDSLLEKTRFRSGQPLPIGSAPEVYKKLSQTPFPSLYGMAAWSEDVAELVSIYHLTHRLKQPFAVVVSEGGRELVRFEPMKNDLIQSRLGQMAAFYVQ